jgi:hypothetical protein
MRSLLLIVIGIVLVLWALGGCTDNLTPPGQYGDDDAVLECLPDLDGVITAAELPVALGVTGDYWVSPPGRQVDLAGTVDEGGLRVWDFASEAADDQRVAFGAEPLDGRWYAGSFPGGAFVLADGEIESVYHRDDQGLWLHGLASREQDPAGGQTLLVYQAPVALLRFPLAVGDAWSESGVVSGGVLDGLPYNGTDTYTIEADGSGELRVPYVTFEQALRVRTHVEVAPAAGGVTTTQRQVSFLFECFGEVARATSRADEPAEDFTVAAAFRRFAL